VIKMSKKYKKPKEKWKIGGFIRQTKSGKYLRFSPTDDLLRVLSENPDLFLVIEVKGLQDVITGKKDWVSASIPPERRADWEPISESKEPFEE